MRSDHPLFARYPLDATVVVDGDTLSSPYHIYDGEIMLIGGRANATAAADLLLGERLQPILDRAGNALMALWVCDFTEANLGPHHELQVSLFAWLGPQAPVSCHPFAIHRLLALNPQAYMVCHGLWNNTPRVVRYNQEHLGLDARLSASRITANPPSGIWDFEVTAADMEQPVASGSLPLQARQPLDVVWAMSQHLGLRGMAQSLRAPFIHVPVVNTRRTYVADNYVAHTYTRSDRQVIRRFGAQDRLVIHDPRYAQLDFRPDFVQHNVGVRFVYLRPASPAS